MTLKPIASFLLLASLAIPLSACGTSKSERALSGGGIGAGVGAAAGALTGGSVVGGAVLGGAAGAVTGAATDKDDINLDD